MRIRVLVLMIFYCSLQYSIGQSENKGLSIGISYGKAEYNGDYGNAIWKLNHPFFNPQVGLSLSAYLSPSLDIGVQYNYGVYGYWEDEENYFTGSKLSGSVFLHYKFNNGYILPETSKISPFISFGIWPGFASYDLLSTDKGQYPTIIVDKVDMILPIGAGLKYNLTDQFSIQYQYLYNFTNSDVHDQNRTGLVNNFFGTSSHPGIKAGNDEFGEHIFSFIVNVNSIGVKSNNSIKGGKGLIRKNYRR